MYSSLKKANCFALSLLSVVTRVFGEDATWNDSVNDGGMLSIADPAALPTALTPIEFNFTPGGGSSSTLQLTAPMIFQNPISIGPAFTGAIDLSGNLIQMTSAITDVSAGGNLFITGGGTLVLSTKASNSGSTLIDCGTTLQIVGTNILSTTSQYDVNGVLDLNSFGQTIESLTGSGSVTLGSATLTISGSSGASIFDGDISGVGNLDVEQGTLVLAAQSGYFGSTVIGASGTIRAGTDNPISSSSSLKVDGALILSDTNGNDFNVNANGLSGSGQIDLGTAGTKSFTLVGNGTNAFSGNIEGTGNLVIGASGVTPTLQLSGNSTYAGETMIWGTLQAESTGALSGSSNYVVKTGAVLDVNGFNSTIEALNGSGAVLMGGAELGVGSGSFSGNIAGMGTLLKYSTGTLSLGGTNVMQVQIEEGTLDVSSSMALGGGDLFFDAGHTGAATATLSVSTANLTFGNNIGVASGFTAVISGGQTTLCGDIVDQTRGGSVVFNGSTTLSGDNSYTGSTEVTVGAQLRVGSPTALSAGSAFDVEGSLILSDGTTDFSATVASLTGAGSIVLGQTGPPQFPTLTITDGNGETFSGNFTSSGSIELQNGTLTLSGTGSTFSGSTTINDNSTLIAGASSALSPNSAIGVGGTLEVGETSQTVPSISGNGSITLGSTGTGLLTFSDNTSFSGNISGSGSLTFEGSTNSLSGDNTYAGSTTVSSGTLSAGSVSALSNRSDFVVDGTLNLVAFDGAINSLAGSGQVDLGSTGTLLKVANGKGLTFSGSLTDSGGLELQSGQLILATTSSNTYSGPTTIDSGATLAAGVTNAFSDSSDFTVNGTLSLSNGSSDFSVEIKSLTGTNSESIVNLGSNGGGILTINGAETTSFQGNLTGRGGLIVGPSTTLNLSGESNYLGFTTVRGVLGAHASGSLSSSSPFEVSGSLDLNDNTSTLLSLSGGGMVDLGTLSTTTLTVGGGDFTGNIVGAGRLNVDTATTFILEADNGYSGGTTITAGTLALKGAGNLLPSNLTIWQGGSFDISQVDGGLRTIADLNGGDLTSSINLGSNRLVLGSNNSTTYGGTIQGTGGSLYKQGLGTITLTGASSYTGGTVVASGTLIGNTANLQSGIQVNLGANLTFNQLLNGTFNGTLLGRGRVFKTGSGILNYVGGVLGFDGTTTVSGGTLALNALLGGSVIVNERGTLSGAGTVSENLTIAGGGTIAPGNSIGTLTVFGNYVQNSNTTYRVRVDGQGDSTQIDVLGVAKLKGGEVRVSLVNGQLLINHPYNILHADGGVFNGFEGITVGNLPSGAFAFSPSLIYSLNDVFLQFKTLFVNAAETHNQMQAANQLDSITHPDPQQTALLSQLAALPLAEVAQILEELTGQQQTGDLFAADLINRAFLRSLYDPIRPIVTTLPCSSCPPPCGWTAWIEGGPERASLDNSSGAFGFKMHGGQVTAGLQKTLLSDLTLGAAASYAYDKINYKQGGVGHMNNALAAIYALYRPNNYYLFADIVYGYFHNKIFRQVVLPSAVLDITSRPELNQFTLYGEGGIDLPCGGLLVQPFAGFEVGGVWRNGIHESGGGDFDLDVERREEGTAYSRLGLHLTTIQWPLWFNASFDAAWQCRLTTNHNCIWEEFSTFGSSFNITGVKPDHNSFQAALTLLFPLDESCTFFAEGSGEGWRNASTYAFTFGVLASW